MRSIRKAQLIDSDVSTKGNAFQNRDSTNKNLILKNYKFAIIINNYRFGYRWFSSISYCIFNHSLS